MQAKGSAARGDWAVHRNHSLRSILAYAASKAASDHLVRAWGRTYGLPVLITNCSNNYRPYQFPEKLVPLMILRALKGKPLPVYGLGENIRDWLYVEDHAEALITVLTRGKPGSTYNIGGASERRNIDMVEAIMDEIFGFLADHGFVLVTLYPFAYENGRASWTDALFVNPHFFKSLGIAPRIRRGRDRGLLQ